MTAPLPALETGAPAPRATCQPPPPTRPDRAAGLLARTIWLWPALLTLFLGTRGSWRPQLWRDELATWSAATRSIGELFDLLRHVDASSGAYYLLMHGWVGLFGDSATVLRLPSALALTGAAIFVTLTARRLFGLTSALISGLLFAAVPAVSRYAQEARSYAFVMLAVSMAAWLLFRALERPTLLRWLPYAVAVAAAGALHLVSLVFLASHAVIVAMRWWRRRERGLLFGFPAAVVVGLLPVVPLMVLGQRQVARQISMLKAPELHLLPGYWHGLFGSALVSVGVLALCAIPAGWARGRRQAFEIGLIAALPILLTWFLSKGEISYFLDRYQLYTVPAWAVLAGAGLGSLRPRGVGAAGLAVVLLLGVPDQMRLRTTTSHELTDGRAAAKIIEGGYRPGDGFVPLRGSVPWMMIDFEIAYYLPEHVRLKDVFAAKTPLERADLFAQPCEQPAACLAGTDRVWVVTMGEADDPYAELPAEEAAALRASYRPTLIEHVRGLTVSLSERR
ncbi:glycosyltransferase family 39 protein [Kitasatospora sp. NPDC002227]|uniref:glycosyltransferase family 39 protein n=1 Tax=Kitasatospora sp. NPDC002227 TaxID=3154773 RepID=UPI003333A273